MCMCMCMCVCASICVCCGALMISLCTCTHRLSLLVFKECYAQVKMCCMQRLPTSHTRTYVYVRMYIYNGPSLIQTPTPVHVSKMFIYVKHTIHSQPEITVSGGAVTSFACSCLLNCFAATDRHANASLSRAVQSPMEFFIQGYKTQ